MTNSEQLVWLADWMAKRYNVENNSVIGREGWPHTLVEVVAKVVEDRTLAPLIREAHETAVEKGWWEKERDFGTQIALMHSELSEALEEYRNDSYPLYTENGKPEGIAAEFADVLIRIFDACGKYGIPLEKALRLKMEYNKTRSHRHGGKVC